MMHLPAISPSKLVAFGNCKKRLKEEVFQRAEPMDYGDAWHEGAAFLCNNLRKGDDGGDYLQAFRVRAKALGLPIENYIDRAIEAFHFVTSDDRVNLRGDTIICVESEDGTEVLYGKKFFTVPMGKWRLRGKIDLAEVDGNTLVITDWKTGFSTPDSDLQLACYAVAGSILYPGFPTIETRFVFPDQKWVQTSEWNAGTIEAAKTNISELGDKFLAEKEWAPKLNDGCRYCTLKENCEVFQKALVATPEESEWRFAPNPDNMPKVVAALAKMEGIQKAAKGYAEALKETRNQILREYGPITVEGKTLSGYEATSSYEYDLNALFVAVQEIIERPPVEICSFDSRGFDTLAKAQDKDTRKKLEALKKEHRAPKSKTYKVRTTVAKE